MWPKENKKKVSGAIRILQQKRDASARATHLMVKNDPLITYESGILGQAAIKKFFIATFLERKQMSTKTSFKRIALVAASALAIGGFSAVSASAANVEGTAVTSLTVAASSGNTGIVDAAYVVNVGAVTVATAASTSTVNTLTFKGVLTTYPSSGWVGVTPVVTASTTTTVITGTTNAVTSGALVASGASATASGGNSIVASSTTGFGSFTFTPTVAGTYKLTVWQEAASNDGVIGVTEPVQTLDITIAAATGFSPQLSTSIVTTAGSTAGTSDDEIRVSSAVTTNGATIRVTLLNTSGTAYNGATLDAQVISGPGLVDVATAASNYADATVRADSLALTGTNVGAVHVTADGTAGKSVIRIRAMDTTTGASLGTIAEENVYFFGAVASLTATNVMSVANASTTAIGCSEVDCTQATVAETPFVTIVAKDADGNLVPALSVSGVISDSTVLGSTAVTASTTKVLTTAGATACAAGTGECNGLGYYNADVAGATGAASGKTATITYRTLLTGTTYITADPVTITIGGAIASETLSLDKDSYDQGEAMVVSRVAKDSAGNTPYDGQTAGEVTFNKPVSGTVGDSWYVGGKKVTSATSPSIYAPASSGSFMAKMTSAADGVTLLTATATVVGDESASLALDAANAATDAANNAYDEAQNATQAASDALAAVTALAKQVKSLIASVKKLTAAVAKLKK